MAIDYIANVRMPTEKAHGLQIVKMCEAWGSTGENVVLWAPMRFNHLKADPFEFYGLKRNFEIKKVFSFDLLPLGFALSRLAFWIQNISFAVLVSLRMMPRKGIIFSRDFWSAFFLSVLGKRAAYEIHDSPNNHFITRYAFKKISKFVVTNNFKAEDIKKRFGVSGHDVLVAPNGVDLEFFNINKTSGECREILGLPRDKKIILYSGHLYSWKGADVLLNALILAERDDICGVFVGGTEADVMKLRAKAGKNEAAIFLGYQEYKKIPYYLCAADILVLPNTAKENISYRDTSPIKLFEYMTAGRPIIASDIPSIREIVNENQVVFFKADDAEDLKDKIISAIDAPGNFADQAGAAKERSKDFSVASRAKKILEFLRATV